MKKKQTLLNWGLGFLSAGILACAWLAGGLSKVYAQGQLVFTTNLTAGATNTLISNACYVSEIDLVSGTGTNDIIYFYDSIGNSNQYGYNLTNFSRITVMTNIVQPLTNGMGTLYTNTYPGEYTTIISNSAITNGLLPSIMQFAIVPSTKQTKAPLRLVCVKGLTVQVPADATNQVVVVYYAFPF